MGSQGGAKGSCPGRGTDRTWGSAAVGPAAGELGWDSRSSRDLSGLCAQSGPGVLEGGDPTAASHSSPAISLLPRG